MLCDPIKAENDKKDLLIVKLKAEVFEMRQKDRDYKLLHELKFISQQYVKRMQINILLHEQYIQLQHKFARVQDEKKRSENSMSLRIEGQYSSQRALTREMDDLKCTLDEQIKKGSDYDKDISLIQRSSDASRLKLDKLQAESRRLGDQSYALKIDIQVQQREEELAKQEVEQLRRQRADELNAVGSLTEWLAGGHQRTLESRDEIEGLKRANQELRVDIEEYNVAERKLDSEQFEAEGKYRLLTAQIEVQARRNKDLECALEGEKRNYEDITARMRAQRAAQEQEEGRIHLLKERKCKYEQEIETAQAQVTDLRKKRADNDEVRDGLERELQTLSTVCEMRMRANRNIRLLMNNETLYC